MFQDTMTRKLFSPAHDLFRDQVRRFVETEILPYHDDWDEQGVVSREVWEKAGAAGMLCPTVPEAYGGSGADYLLASSCWKKWLGLVQLAPVSASTRRWRRRTWRVSAAMTKKSTGFQDW